MNPTAYLLMVHRIAEGAPHFMGCMIASSGPMQTAMDGPVVYSELARVTARDFHEADAQLRELVRQHPTLAMLCKGSEGFR